ncbi:ABC transporter ATP-binding protein [Aromatoleum bremense]|uniref:ATP-binding cassette domain-containing protein n=1 Tax=Aromatoleum bremense TaxID=76115 RepID=A0ABX1NZP2_9RHOO|nr:ABC transporter ATP-binding protein [Aromatoleum bremense]NMG17535.1 ATP-binding cassette domain-containing protein [Aromatoleum bremense]QTQ30274.1 ABC transporter, ATP-binding protein [Aromatoleum bremense]
MSDRHEVLRVSGLQAWYGESHVLHGVDFTVREGEVVSLLGRNGAGRTTTLRALLGLTDRRTGSVQVRGRETMAMAPHQVARLGLGYCPEERGIFASLSCEENLTLLPRVGAGDVGLSEIYAMFPNLAERRRSPGTRLSGGEQQMLALGRILLTGARTLLLDEISEGLAPVIVQSLGRAISALRARGYTIVLVEQNFRFAAPLADRHLLMEHGRIVADIPRAEVARRQDVFREVLGV